MEHEKKYQEGIIRATQLWECGDITRENLEYIFPELAESEDERVRKALIDYFDDANKADENPLQSYDIHTDKAIAWLEKRSEPTDINPSEFVFSELKESGNIRIIKAIKYGLDHVFTNNTTVFEVTKEQCLAWLEKQGEHAKFLNKIQIGDKVTRNQDGVLVNLSQLKRVAKPAEEYNITGIGSKNAQGKLGEMIKNLKPVNEILEQKSADKVEPKFEIGDLITNGILVGKIDEIHELGYHAYFGDHYADVPDIENWHKWTIQDAKDGDVLAYVTDEEDLWIMIYWSLYEPYEGHVHYHALLVNDNFSDKGTCCICINDLKPATKEQRDLLFQKMKESGYEWDAEKKKSKKIEKKSAEWSEKDEERIEQICDDLKCGLENFRSGKNVKGLHFEEIIKSNIDWLKSLKDSKDRVQPKQEWSEEDEAKLKSACALIRNTSLNGNEGVEDFTINWLKSLKGRIQTKQGWKPSNEQMESLFALLPTICSSNPIFSLYEDLKKLKG